MIKLFKELISISLVVTVLAVGLAGCAPKEEDISNEAEAINEQRAPINIGVLKGPTGMGMVKVMEENSTLEVPNYDFSAYSSPDELVGKIINKEVDIAALPTNLASVLYNKTEGEIAIIAVNTLGVLYVVDSTGSIQSMKDLVGKKIYASGKGTVVEYAFSYLLRSNGIDPENDLEIDYTFSHEELATAVASGEVEIALLPQPHVTTALMKNKDVTIAIDLTKEWDSLDNGSQLTMGCLVANKNFIEENKEQVNQFLNTYAQSVAWVNDNPELAGEWVEKYEILGNKTIAAIAIPQSSIVYIEGQEAKEMLQGFFEVLFEQNPKALGGALPNDAFYYER